MPAPARDFEVHVELPVAVPGSVHLSRPPTIHVDLGSTTSQSANSSATPAAALEAVLDVDRDVARPSGPNGRDGQVPSSYGSESELNEISGDINEISNERCEPIEATNLNTVSSVSWTRWSLSDAERAISPSREATASGSADAMVADAPADVADLASARADSGNSMSRYGRWEESAPSSPEEAATGSVMNGRAPMGRWTGRRLVLPSAGLAGRQRTLMISRGERLSHGLCNSPEGDDVLMSARRLEWLSNEELPLPLSPECE